MLGASRKTAKLFPRKRLKPGKNLEINIGRKKNLWQKSQEEHHEKYYQKLLQKSRRNLGRKFWRITTTKKLAQKSKEKLWKKANQNQTLYVKSGKKCVV